MVGGVPKFSKDGKKGQNSANLSPLLVVCFAKCLRSDLKK